MLIRTDNTTVMQYLNRWRGEICRALSFNMGNMVSSTREIYVSESSPYCRKEKYIDRQSESMEGQANRVGIEQVKCGQDFLYLGSSIDRSVCHSREQESSDILFLAPTLSSICDRCAFSGMDQYVYICLSANGIDSKSVAVYETVSVSDNPDSTSVAKTNFVPEIVEIADCSAAETPICEQSVVTGEVCDSTPRSSVSMVDAMAVVDRHFSERGFLKELENYWQLHGDIVQRKITTQNSNSSVIGVVDGIPILIIHL